MKFYLFLLLLCTILTLACGITTLPVAEKRDPANYAVSAIAVPVPSTVRIVEVTAYAVNIRTADGTRTGEYFTKGYLLTGKIDGDWFVLSDGRKVWLGCVSVDSGLGCESE